MAIPTTVSKSSLNRLVHRGVNRSAQQHVDTQQVIEAPSFRSWRLTITCISTRSGWLVVYGGGEGQPQDGTACQDHSPPVGTDLASRC